MAMLVKKLIDEKILEARTEVYQRGDVLFEAGKSPEKVYFLVHGHVCFLDKEAQPLLKPIKSGAVLGLADIMNDHHQYSALVLELTEVQVIERHKLLQLIEHNPALRLYFLRLLSVGLASAQPVYE